MRPKKPSRREMEATCDALGPEDGLDPRDFLRKTEGKVISWGYRSP